MQPSQCVLHMQVPSGTGARLHRVFQQLCCHSPALTHYEGSGLDKRLVSHEASGSVVLSDYTISHSSFGVALGAAGGPQQLPSQSPSIRHGWSDAALPGVSLSFGSGRKLLKLDAQVFQVISLHKPWLH